MEGYDASTYGERIADVYDSFYQDLLDPTPAVELLAELAGGGPALELGIGTGRVALPLMARGVEVHGVDTSERMVAKMRAKPGGDDVKVFFGDFTSIPVEGRYGLIYIPFNTFFALPSQDAQVECFASAARALTDDGVFLVEAFVPDAGRYDQHQRVAAEYVSPDRVFLEVSRHDPVTQTSMSQHVVLESGKVEMYPVLIRYAFPSEMDLMARLAGLVLRHRWGGWERQPFTSDSHLHISVYGRP